MGGGGWLEGYGAGAFVGWRRVPEGGGVDCGRLCVVYVYMTPRLGVSCFLVVRQRRYVKLSFLIDTSRCFLSPRDCVRELVID